MFNWFDEPKAAKPRKKLTKDQRFEVWKKYIGATKAEGPLLRLQEDDPHDRF